MTTNPIKQRLEAMVTSWFHSQTLTILPNQKIITHDGKNANIDSLLRKFQQDTLDQSGQQLTKESKRDAFFIYVEEQAELAASSFINQLTYNPASESAGIDELNKWLQSVIGRTPTQLDLAAMKHFIWQIKRKSMNLPVSYHMMNIFTGNQGDGKSEAIKRLLQPIIQLTIQGQSVTYITDVNNYKTIGMNLCIFTDEMSRCSAVDIERLKQVITGTDLNYRIFHTQNNGYADQRCTLIGASNKEFRELIQDPTGVRRFYPYRCKPHVSEDERRARWDVVNNIDPYLIWHGINENQEEPYIIPYLNELRAYQENLRTPGSIEEWLTDYELEPGTHKISLAELYNSYKQAATDSNRKDVFSKRAFKLTLQDRGFVEQKYSNGNVNYLCNKRSLLEGVKPKIVAGD